MEANDAVYYRALKSRDARFDGRFFNGVKSTGIFCRPICPAPTPKKENCHFYPTAAAAMVAGFRPCMRCRPESAPGSPAWNGVATTAGRALRLINEGALDDNSVESLAEKCGVGSRHLSRLFQKHVGASPVKVAQTRRTLFAKQLITQSGLAFNDIAMLAGFGSVRRFNDVFKSIYGKTPGALRGQSAPAMHNCEAGFSLNLAFRPPYDWSFLLAFLKKRAVPGLEAVDHMGYRRTVTLKDMPGVLSIRSRPENNCLQAVFHFTDLTHIQSAITKTRRLFDLDTDSMEIDSFLKRDPLLSPLVKPGIRIPGAWSLFELAVRAILGQQVSVAGAVTFAARLVERFGTPLDNSPSKALTHTFPRPDQLAEADIAAIGLPAKRAESIRHLAVVFADNQLKLSGDFAAIETSLCELPGIGKWTAQYIAMRGLGEPDAFPCGDLGLMRAVGRLGRTVNRRQLEALSENWRPWRAYAVMTLWRSL